MIRPMLLHFYRSPDGWRWRIRAANGRIVADSAEAYVRLGAALYGASLVTNMHVNGRPGTEHDAGFASSWRVRVDK